MSATPPPGRAGSTPSHAEPSAPTDYPATRAGTTTIGASSAAPGRPRNRAPTGPAAISTNIKVAAPIAAAPKKEAPADWAANAAQAAADSDSARDEASIRT